MGDPAAEANALVWSLTAMTDATGRLPWVRSWDRPRALAAIGEAVWWVTIVDATLVRHHPEAYDAVMAGQAPAEREQVEGILAGLRFVRNQIGADAHLGEFTGPGEPGPGESSPDGSGPGGPGPGAGEGPVSGWTWKPVPHPALASLPPRGRAWEMTRYQAYEAHLAGHSIGEIFGRAATFLELTAAKAAPATGAATHAARPRRWHADGMRLARLVGAPAPGGPAAAISRPAGRRGTGRQAH
jgi:hypothetical protein